MESQAAPSTGSATTAVHDASAHNDSVTVGTLADPAATPAAITLPLVITAQQNRSIMDMHTDSLMAPRVLDDWLQHHGGILFRGFQVRSPLAFRKFAAGFGAPLMEYTYASTPRSKVVSGVYSSTEYPPHQSIPLHNEQAYTREWPSRIWFHCLRAAASGGETPIADSRVVYQQLDPELRDLFAQRELLYVRNYSPALDLPWQQVFNTEERGAVEQYCAQHAIEWEWRGDDELRTRQRCQAVIRHPSRGEMIWFNQAHLFHASALESKVRHSLVSAVGEANLPRNVYFGDGEPIPDAMLDQVRAVYARCAVSFPWQNGDVLMLDNRLAAHGRNPFSGERKVIVAMA